MSQNLSKMTDIYIPELMELDSYWQKAVEDAMCDTLKGKKRLSNALRNRRKIKEKLEKIGYSQYNMSSEEDRESLDSASGMSEELDTENILLEVKASGSKEKTSIEKRVKTPDRPLLGNGSLEKMKKSQNSFNYEPMGIGNRDEVLTCSEASEFESDEVRLEDDGGKKVEWLHVRKDRDFDRSDSESANNPRGSVGIVKNEFRKRATLKDKNYFISKKLPLRRLRPMRQERVKDSSWESESEDSTPPNPNLHRRLQLALAKMKIINETLEATRLGNVCADVTLNEAAMKQRAAAEKYALPPFVRFYLQVYRELCHRSSVKHITKEAGRRWCVLTSKEKAALDGATAS